MTITPMRCIRLRGIRMLDTTTHHRRSGISSCPREMRLTAADRKRLEAADGFLALGLPMEAHEELEAIEPDARHRSEVLELRFGIYQTLERWELFQTVAATLVGRARRTFARSSHWLRQNGEKGGSMKRGGCSRRESPRTAAGMANCGLRWLVWNATPETSTGQRRRWKTLSDPMEPAASCSPRPRARTVVEGVNVWLA